MSESLYVPSSTIQRIRPILTWIGRGLVAGSAAAWAFGWSWLNTRASIDDVASRISPAITAAAAAQEAAHHTANIADQAMRLAVETARMEAELWGQAAVERAYNTSPRRQEYIQRARDFYVNAFDDLRKSPQYVNDPVGALERVRRMTWRPDRPD